MNNGFIEIGSIITQTSSGVVKKLKSILDRHGIFHIFGGVMFYPPDKNGARQDLRIKNRIGEVEHARDSWPREKQLPIDLEKYQELIVPDLYKLNFISLMYFDAEEADFLSDLIYREH